MSEKTTTKTETKTVDVKDSVLHKLEESNICPRSRMFWRCQSCLVWVLWGFTVLFGALSVAIIIFAGAHARFALHEATHSSFLAFTIEVLPYLWVAVFLVMTALAYYNFRHTKFGYRHPFTHIIISSIGFSLVGGVLLHVGGLGYHLDMTLGRYSKMYKSQEEIALGFWQSPEEGRLVGMMVPGSLRENLMEFRDVDGEIQSWV